MTFSSFYKSCLELSIPELLLIEEGEVRSQYRMLSQELIENECDKYILKEVLKKSESYADVSLILHILSCSAITKSVESIVESWGSQMEDLSSSKRTVTEVRLHDEMMICLNGPVLTHCDTIVGKALDSLNSIIKVLETELMDTLFADQRTLSPTQFLKLLMELTTEKLSFLS